MAELKVKPLEHMNVRGKKLYYLSIDSGVGTPYVINVGEGTYNECMKMLKDAEAQLELGLGAVEGVTSSEEMLDSLSKMNKMASDGTKGSVSNKDHKD